MPTQGDHAENALGATETTETNLGTVTVPSQGVSKIVGVAAAIIIQTATAAEGAAGYVKLAFKSVPGTYKFPAAVFQGPAGTLANSGPAQQPQIIPVDIPVPPNETITCYAALFLAQTGTCRGYVGLIFE